MAAMQDDKEEFECSIVLCEECFFQYKLEIPENLKQKNRNISFLDRR